MGILEPSPRVSRSAAEAAGHAPPTTSAGRLPLDEPTTVRLVAIDVETTGVDPARDRITEVAVVALDSEMTWSSMVRPADRKAPHPDVTTAPAFCEIAHSFLQELV